MQGVATAIGLSPDPSEAEWDAFVESHVDATVYHLWGWRRVIEKAFGHQAVYLAARADGRIVGILPLVVFKAGFSAALPSRCRS